MHWEDLIKRFPGRSNGKAGRKAKAKKSKPLAGVFEQQARMPEKLFTKLGCKTKAVAVARKKLKKVPERRLPRLMATMKLKQVIVL